MSSKPSPKPLGESDNTTVLARASTNVNVPQPSAGGPRRRDFFRHRLRRSGGAAQAILQHLALLVRVASQVWCKCVM